MRLRVCVFAKVEAGGVCVWGGGVGGGSGMIGEADNGHLNV